MNTLGLFSLVVSVIALGLAVRALRMQAQARAIAQQALDLAQQATVSPAASGGPRPKPLGTDAAGAA